MKNFVHLHMHTDLSNSNLYESVTAIDDYIKQAKEWGMPAVCVTNHGNVASWFSNKQKVEKAGLRYIHGMEAYVTMDNNDSDKKTADNYHMILLAKNWDGVREINRLSSDSFNRKDNHYYYKPRIFFDELKETSDNVIILTGCLGSGLNQSRVNNRDEELSLWIDFITDNKSRVYLEVQPHINQEQKDYNEFLCQLSIESGMKLVATNDVHNLTSEHNEVAKAIKASKGIVFDSDDEFETTFKSREQMVESFLEQGVFTEDKIEEALNSTIEIVDQIEDFEVDTSIRYPHIFNKNKQLVGKTDISKMRSTPFKDSLDLFKHLAVQGFKERGLDKLPEDKQLEYKKQILHELNIYIKTDSIDYMLLEYSLKREAREFVVNPNKSIRCGYGRGSVAGSLIAYLLYVTEVDPIREGLMFERFMSPDRIGVPD